MIASTNGASRTVKGEFDPSFTQGVIDNIGPRTGERERVVFTSLIRHLHDFIREIELTPEEWMSGVQFINSIGQGSVGKRNEGQRVSDILGVESLVDEIASKAFLSDKDHPTSSTILGPFWSPHAPFRNLGDSIIQDPDPAGKVTWMHGTVKDVTNNIPIVNAVVDIWQASANGEYDLNDGKQSENNLRGKFRTNESGEYYFYCYHPTAYSIPTDGAAGALLKVLDRHSMRTAHIHVMVTAEGFRSVTTQLFPRSDPNIASDTVFAVKEDLILDFTTSNDPNADLDLKYDFTLAPLKPGMSKGWSHTVF